MQLMKQNNLGCVGDEAFRQFLSRFPSRQLVFFYCRVYPEYVFTRKNETQREIWKRIYAQNTFAGLAAAVESLELSRLIACIIVCHFMPVQNTIVIFILSASPLSLLYSQKKYGLRTMSGEKG